MTINHLITRHYRETLTNGIETGLNDSIADIMKRCEAEECIYSMGEFLVSMSKIRKDDDVGVRMIFSIKEVNKGRIKSLDSILELIYNLELLLTFIDTCYITKSDSGIVFIVVDRMGNL